MLLDERSPLLTSIPVDFGISPDKSASVMESCDGSGSKIAGAMRVFH
jgi:hypothetical protein